MVLIALPYEAALAQLSVPTYSVETRCTGSMELPDYVSAPEEKIAIGEGTLNVKYTSAYDWDSSGDRKVKEDITVYSDGSGGFYTDAVEPAYVDWKGVKGIFPFEDDVEIKCKVEIEFCDSGTKVAGAGAQKETVSQLEFIEPTIAHNRKVDQGLASTERGFHITFDDPVELEEEEDDSNTCGGSSSSQMESSTSSQMESSTSSDEGSGTSEDSDYSYYY